LFLHQAILAATILSKTPRAGIRELSFMYNYPLLLHGKVPENLKPGRLEDVTTLRYEDFETLQGSELLIPTFGRPETPTLRYIRELPRGLS
jgi:hypothetical protein